MGECGKDIDRAMIDYMLVSINIIGIVLEVRVYKGESGSIFTTTEFRES